MPAATCHCGAVKIEVDTVPPSVTECTCSICRRYGARWAYCTRRTARVLTHPDNVRAYVWGDRTIEFYHCRHCGCPTHYESVEKTDGSRVAVNARLLPPDEMATVRIRIFDGADTWKYLHE